MEEALLIVTVGLIRGSVMVYALGLQLSTSAMQFKEHTSVCVQRISICSAAENQVAILMASSESKSKRGIQLGEVSALVKQPKKLIPRCQWKLEPVSLLRVAIPEPNQRDLLYKAAMMSQVRHHVMKCLKAHASDELQS